MENETADMNQPTKGSDEALVQESAGQQLKATVFGFERGFYYWFEKAGEERLEILQVEAIDKTVVNKRLDATPAKDFAKAVQYF